MSHLALPDPGGRGHDVHTYRALELLPGGVDDYALLWELVVLAGAVALVRDVPLPETWTAAVAHCLTAWQLYVSFQ